MLNNYFGIFQNLNSTGAFHVTFPVICIIGFKGKNTEFVMGL